MSDSDIGLFVLKVRSDIIFKVLLHNVFTYGRSAWYKLTISNHCNELKMTTSSGPAQLKLKTRKPGRPRKTPSVEGKPRDIKNDILDATVALIAEFGFDGFVLRDVADAVGVHTALVGYYFKTKQQLEKAALDRRISQLESIFPQLQPAEELPPSEAIRSLFVGLAKMLDQGEAGHRFNGWTFAKGGKYAEEITSRFCMPTIARITRHFQKLLPDQDSVECSTRALLLFTLAQNCAALKACQLKVLKMDYDPDLFAEKYYQLIESQLIPQVFLVNRNDFGAIASESNITN
jgi:AcrR family transcriptional regulator